MIVIGKVDDATIMQARTWGESDNGTKPTSWMIVESALCLAEGHTRHELRTRTGRSLVAPRSAVRANQGGVRS